MSNWADDLIAGPLGYRYCVLFPRAREAIKAWTEITHRPVKLPTNICPIAKEWATYFTLHDIDETGMAPGITTQLYGYREEGDGKSELDLDPLGTGFFSRPCAASSIVSFGEKKFITVGGAAFSTNDQGLAQEMESRTYFPPALEYHLKIYLPRISFLRDQRRDKVYLWDRHLGDCLNKPSREQIVPWRVMRLAECFIDQQKIVEALRDGGHDVGTNYPPVALMPEEYKSVWFGSRVLNFFVSDDYDESRIRDACEITKRAVA